MAKNQPLRSNIRKSVTTPRLNTARNQQRHGSLRKTETTSNPDTARDQEQRDNLGKSSPSLKNKENIEQHVALEKSNLERFHTSDGLEPLLDNNMEQRDPEIFKPNCNCRDSYPVNITGGHPPSTNVACGPYICWTLDQNPDIIQGSAALLYAMPDMCCDKCSTFEGEDCKCCDAAAEVPMQDPETPADLYSVAQNNFNTVYSKSYSVAESRGPCDSEQENHVENRCPEDTLAQNDVAEISLDYNAPSETAIADPTLLKSTPTQPPPNQASEVESLGVQPLRTQPLGAQSSDAPTLPSQPLGSQFSEAQPLEAQSLGAQQTSFRAKTLEEEPSATPAPNTGCCIDGHPNECDCFAYGSNVENERTNAFSWPYIQQVTQHYMPSYPYIFFCTQCTPYCTGPRYCVCQHKKAQYRCTHCDPVGSTLSDGTCIWNGCCLQHRVCYPIRDRRRVALYR